MSSIKLDGEDDDNGVIIDIVVVNNISIIFITIIT